MADTYTPVARAYDPWLEHAMQVIYKEYSVRVTPEAKNKDLIKYGYNPLTNLTKSTLMVLPTGVDNETYVSSNLITTVSSSSGSDTYQMTVEGHTIDGNGDFTFVTQNVTLQGQTQVALTTPLARVSQTYNIGSANSVGNIYVYETDTSTLGVPDTAVKVHLIQQAGINNSEKSATTISSSDYYVITAFHGDCLEKATNFATVHLEIRKKGGVFIDQIDLSANNTARGKHEFKPYLIVPPNADVRLRAESSTAGREIAGGFQGILLRAT